MYKDKLSSINKPLTEPKYKQPRTIEAQRRFISLYVKHEGNLRQMSSEAGIDKSTFYVWIANDPKFVEDLHKATLEYDRIRRITDISDSISIEKTLYGKCKEGDIQGIKFFLKNRSPSRWHADDTLRNIYIDNMKVDINNVENTINGLSLDELQSKVAELTTRLSQNNTPAIDIIPEDDDTDSVE